MARVKARESKVKDGKVAIKFDIKILNLMLKYVVSKYVKISDLGNIKKLFYFLDMDAYKYNADIFDRIQVIKYIAEARTDKNIKDVDVMYSYVESSDPDTKELLDSMSWEDDQLTIADIKFVGQVVSDKLEYIYVYQYKDEIIEDMQRFDNADFVLMKDLVDKARKDLSKLLMNLQNTNIDSQVLRKFSFSEATVHDAVDVIIGKLKKPSSILQTGIRQFNAILAPGFQSKKLYVILGLSGKFKSGTLLNIADQLRRYNPQVRAVENGKRKTILFVTMENTIEETVERLFDMYSDENSELAGETTDSVMDLLRTEGQYIYTEDSGIDLDFRYYQNLEISTAQLYNLIQELDDGGKEVIALILDYIKRIDSTYDSRGDERTRLAYAARELKSLAVYFEIPVITAMQINREGNTIVDAAMREDKEDITRFVGASQIANCWDIVEESDWMAVVNLETQRSTGKLFLTIKRVKIRGKQDPTAADYFNHPFVNNKNIRLETDVDKEYSVSVRSLATDLASVDQEMLEREMSQSRPKMSSDGARKVADISGMLQAQKMSRLA